MEFTVSKADLVRELGLSAGVVEKATTIPILTTVLIEARDDELALTATDLELGIRCGCPATVKKAGSVSLPLRKLLDYVRLLPEGDLSVKVAANHAASVTSGRSRAKIAGMSRENFPVLPSHPGEIAQIPVWLLANLIGKTAFAISDEGSAYTLGGALLMLQPDCIRMVATDGHRLALAEAPHAFEGLGKDLKALVPKKALAEISRLAVDAGKDAVAGFASDENSLYFQFGRRLLTTRKLSGQFPDYARVLPSVAAPYKVALNREALAASLKRVMQFADERSHAVRIEATAGELKLVSKGLESGESEDSLAVESGGVTVQTGFNARYLLDFLGAVLTETVQLELRDENSAGELQPVGEPGCSYRYVVMPLRA